MSLRVPPITVTQTIQADPPLASAHPQTPLPASPQPQAPLLVSPQPQAPLALASSQPQAPPPAAPATGHVGMNRTLGKPSLHHKSDMKSKRTGTVLRDTGHQMARYVICSSWHAFCLIPNNYTLQEFLWLGLDAKPSEWLENRF